VTVDLTNRAWAKGCDVIADGSLHHKTAVSGIMVRSSLGASGKRTELDKSCGK
jgi:hypothetical protein